MGFLKRLLGERQDPSYVRQVEGALEVDAVLFDGDFELNVVGESHYQEALEKAAGGRSAQGARLEITALLIPEPDNPHDGNAVAVWIEGGQVGHLSRHDAQILQAKIIDINQTRQRAVACRGLILGGWDGGGGDRGHFGVKIFIDPADFDVDADDLDGRWHTRPGSGSHTGATRSARRDPAGPGMVDGIHYTDHVERVKGLRRIGQEEEAEALLLQLVEATEAEAAGEGLGVAPWYYEQLAIIYKKRKDFDAEVRILERYAEQTHAPGVKPPKLLERLEKARARRDRVQG